MALGLSLLFTFGPGISVPSALAAEPGTWSGRPDPQEVAPPKPPSATYTRNLYDGRLVRYQDPDYTACVASSTLMMLNFVASMGTKGPGFRWTKTTSYSSQEQILAWERAYDSYASTSPGTDPHGWRNGLNHFGWDAFTKASTMVYADRAYSSYDAAVKASVESIARFGKAVGILGWAGGHAQIMNGYEVYGQDPALSSDFRVVSVYLTDPLRSDRLRNARISNADFKNGSTVYRFRPYAWTDSPKDDPYTPGDSASYKEWYGKWVVVLAVR